VKAFTRVLCLAFVVVGMLGVAGCGPDNEAEGQKANAKLGDPGKMNEGTGKTVAPPPKTNEERGARGAQGSINMFDAKGKPKPSEK